MTARLFVGRIEYPAGAERRPDTARGPGGGEQSARWRRVVGGGGRGRLDGDPGAGDRRRNTLSSSILPGRSWVPFKRKFRGARSSRPTSPL